MPPAPWETELPVAQAGMGGGISGHELAAAVSEAGGLGTIAASGPGEIERELAAARRLTAKPIAVNVLLPFARRSWFRAAAAADVVVTFWGAPRRRTPGTWLHQAGSPAEARAAFAAGASGVIVQGVEAGGHVRGALPALELLERTRRVVPPGFPLLVAGGIAEAADVQRALEAGARGVVCGTRFLMASESRAHPAYKARVAEAAETVLTDLFGFGWPARHRVVPNAAVRHWASAGRRSRAVNRLIAGVSGAGARFTPARVQGRLAAAQRPEGRLLSPFPPTTGGPARLVDAGPLYAGETARRIGDIRDAAELVAALVP
jgi:NAD(P)H-dependent flavin oxidoreductase YrpB (nitropropane dioxygenase family)